MAVDFTSPAKTQNYDTGVLQSLRANQQALAAFLDGHSITGNYAGLKRYNAGSQLFEKSDGATWSEMALAYLKTSGGTLTGALTLAANATQNLQPVTLQQMNSALSGTATSGALAAYAQLAGASFTGSVGVAGNLSTGGTFGASGTIYSASNITAAGAVLSSDSTLSTKGTFYLSAANATTPIINFDGGDYVSYDRAGNGMYFNMGGATPLFLSAGGATIAGGFTLKGNSGAGDNYGANNRIVNTYTGGGPYFRVSNVNALEFVDSAYSRVNLALNDNGDAVHHGLVFGNGAGYGVGAVFVQQGGGPSGGVNGDVFLVY